LTIGHQQPLTINHASDGDICQFDMQLNGQTVLFADKQPDSAPVLNITSEVIFNQPATFNQPVTITTGSLTIFGWQFVLVNDNNLRLLDPNGGVAASWLSTNGRAAPDEEEEVAADLDLSGMFDF
jgi:hypothetical protein